MSEKKDGTNYVGPLLIAAGAKIPVPASLRLDGPPAAHVRRTFKRYGLDPTNLVDWYTLLFKLSGKRGGPPLKWSALRLLRLRADVERLRHRNPGESDTWCCREISKNKDKSNPFKGEDVGTLRRRLADARKPEMRQSYEYYFGKKIGRRAKEV